MKQCMNCRALVVDGDAGALRVQHCTATSYVCHDCLQGTQCVKIVLRLNKDGSLEGEQYACLEIVKQPINDD